MRTSPMRRLLLSTTRSVVLIAPASSAAAMVKAFITEPGSYWRLTAGLVNRDSSVLT